MRKLFLFLALLTMLCLGVLLGSSNKTPRAEATSWSIDDHVLGIGLYNGEATPIVVASDGTLQLH